MQFLMKTGLFIGLLWYGIWLWLWYGMAIGLEAHSGLPYHGSFLS